MTEELSTMDKVKEYLKKTWYYILPGLLVCVSVFFWFYQQVALTKEIRKIKMDKKRLMEVHEKDRQISKMKKDIKDEKANIQRLNELAKLQSREAILTEKMNQGPKSIADEWSLYLGSKK